MTEQTTAPAAVASQLAADMLCLLAGSANSPIEHMIREGLLADDAKLAEILQRDLSRVAPGDHRQVAVIVSSFVRHIVANATREVRNDLAGIRYS